MTSQLMSFNFLKTNRNRERRDAHTPEPKGNGAHDAADEAANRADLYEPL